MKNCHMNYDRGVAGGRGVARCDGPPPPPSSLFLSAFALFIYYRNLNIVLNLFNETITLFLKQLQAKILHRECREVAKKLWFWWNIVYQLYKIYIFQSQILIWQNNLKFYNSYDFPDAILHECKRSCKFANLYSSFLWKVQCFYFWISKDSLVLLSTRDKRISIKFHKNQRLNTGTNIKKILESSPLES